MLHGIQQAICKNWDISCVVMCYNGLEKYTQSLPVRTVSCQASTRLGFAMVIKWIDSRWLSLLSKFDRFTLAYWETLDKNCLQRYSNVLYYEVDRLPEPDNCWVVRYIHDFSTPPYLDFTMTLLGRERKVQPCLVWLSYCTAFTTQKSS